MIRPMKYRFVLLGALALLACTSCTEFVGNAARSSFASFLTQVFSTAVTTTLTGN